MKVEYYGALEVEKLLIKAKKKIEKDILTIKQKLEKMKEEPLLVVKGYEVTTMNDLHDLVASDIISADRYFVLSEKLKAKTFELDNLLAIEECALKIATNILSQVSYTKERYSKE